MEHRQLWQFSTAVSAHDWDQDPYMLSLSETHLIIQSFLFSLLQQGLVTTALAIQSWMMAAARHTLKAGSQLDPFLVHSVLTRLERVLDFSCLRFLFDCSHLGSVSKLPKKNLCWRGGFSDKDTQRSGLFLLSQCKKNNRITAIYVTNYKILLLHKGVTRSSERKDHVHGLSGLMHNINKRWNPAVS